MNDQAYAEGLARYWNNVFRDNESLTFKAGDACVHQYWNGRPSCVWTIASDASGVYASHATEMVRVDTMPWAPGGNQ